MASKSFISRSCILLLLIAVCLLSVIHAQDHAHEDGAVHSHDDHDHDHANEESCPHTHADGSVHDPCKEKAAATNDHAHDNQESCPHTHADGSVHDPCKEKAAATANDHAHDHDHANEESCPHTHADGSVHDPCKENAAGAAHDHDHDHDHESESVSSKSTSGHSHSHHGHAHGPQSCDVEDMVNYNMPMRIGAIFIILATSAVGVFAPIILYRISPFQEGSVRDWILTAGKFFGTGVIISTAFIHMLPEALERFGSECLSDGWHSYHAFGGLFCMLASFALQVIELTALSNLDAIAKRNATKALSATPNSEELAAAKLGEKTYSPDSLASHEHNHHGISQDGHVHSAGFLENDQALRSISTFILELGILMHSVIIGITLGTVDSSFFITLLIALVFHQFFEGIALGTRVNELQCKSWTKPIIMGLLFVTITPIGVAIGIGIRSTMNPRSSILAQAILDSLSAGILLYSAYVSLMSIEINHNVGFRKSSLGRKVFCFTCMYLGAAMMSIIGMWA